MKYKVGDKVRVQPLEWYQKEIESEKWCPNIFDIYWCSREMTISKIEKSHYLMEEDGQEFWWIDEMIEGLVEEEIKSEDGLLDEYEELTDRAFKGGYEKCKSDIELNGFQLPEGYQFVDENGNVINATKIVLEKKKKEYPKTYEECYQITGLSKTSDIYGYKNGLLFDFQKLLIARDAYWRIAGAEMGLGKPWEPDYNSLKTKYTIEVIENKVVVISTISENHILAFPTEEMRDAFYENFKEEIEQCKELL